MHHRHHPPFLKKLPTNSSHRRAPLPRPLMSERIWLLLSFGLAAYHSLVLRMTPFRIVRQSSLWECWSISTWSFSTVHRCRPLPLSSRLATRRPSISERWLRIPWMGHFGTYLLTGLNLLCVSVWHFSTHTYGTQGYLWPRNIRSFCVRTESSGNLSRYYPGMFGTDHA